MIHRGEKRNRTKTRVAVGRCPRYTESKRIYIHERLVSVWGVFHVPTTPDPHKLARPRIWRQSVTGHQNIKPKSGAEYPRPVQFVVDEEIERIKAEELRDILISRKSSETGNVESRHDLLEASNRMGKNHKVIM